MNKKGWNVEQVKLIFDHTKHVTTLSTGSIVVLVTFYEKLSSNPSWNFLVGLALIAFVISIISATLSQIGSINLAEPSHTESSPGKGLWSESPAMAVSLIVSWVSFLVVVLALCVFGMKNL